MTAVMEPPVVSASPATSFSGVADKVKVDSRITFRVTSAFDRPYFYEVLRAYLGPEFLKLHGSCLELSAYTRQLWRALQRRFEANPTCEVSFVLPAKESFKGLSERMGVVLPEVCDDFLHTKSLANPKERVVLTLRGSHLVFEQGVVAA